MSKKPIIGKILLWCFVLVLFACKNKSEKSDNPPSLASAEIKRIFINGDSIHYIDIGKGEPVIFVHGTLGDYRVWAAQADSFAKNYRVIAYSRRYAYPNRRVMNDSADYSVMMHSRDLAELIKALDIGPVHLVGHSFGAFTSLLTTMHHPNLVKSLTLGEPPVMSILRTMPGGDTILNNFLAGFGPVTEAFKSGNDEKAISLFITGVIGDSTYFSNSPPEARAMMMENKLELRGSILKDPFVNVTCEDLQKIKTPILLMKGERTTALFSLITDGLSKCISNKENVVLPGATHGLEIENPSGFNSLVFAFIDKH